MQGSSSSAGCERHSFVCARAKMSFGLFKSFSLLGQVKVETVVESGDPRDVICQMVEHLGADVLVMGSRGYGVIKRWVPLPYFFLLHYFRRAFGVFFNR